MPPPRFPRQPFQVPEGPADITLENDRVVVDAPFLLLKGNRKEVGSDFEIDNSGRRTEHENPRRRALVHDFDDRLTLNWGKDYPGGVRILGDVGVPGHLDAGSIETHGLVVTHTASSPGQVAGQPVDPARMPLRRVGGEGATTQTVTLDVGDELVGLRRRVAQLEAAVAVLQEGLKDKDK